MPIFALSMDFGARLDALDSSLLLSSPLSASPVLLVVSLIGVALAVAAVTALVFTRILERRK